MTRTIIAENGKYTVYAAEQIVGEGGYCNDDKCHCDGIWANWGEGVSAAEIRGIVCGTCGPRYETHVESRRGY